MAVKSKKEKVSEARKNAEALKAQKKTQRDTKAKQESGTMSGNKQAGQKKGPSLIKQATKKKK